jgi:hypothetical protein
MSSSSWRNLGIGPSEKSDHETPGREDRRGQGDKGDGEKES